MSRLAKRNIGSDAVFLPKKRAVLTGEVTYMDKTRFEELNLIRLVDALLCANCELIVSECVNGGCPACGSRAMLSVSKALGGTLEGSHTDQSLSELNPFGAGGWKN